MPYSNYRPDLMGTAALTPTGAFEAGSLQSFTLVYTAGAFGIDDTGSIKIGLRFATDFGPLQFTDPKGQGYTTVEASNGATLEAKWEFKRNIRPWSRSLYIGVVRDFLAPGDTITIRFGDRRFGSPGVRLQTYCESAFEFRVFADPIATYDYVALPQSPQIALVPGPPVRLLPCCRPWRGWASRSGWRWWRRTSGATRAIAPRAALRLQSDGPDPQPAARRAVAGWIVCHHRRGFARGGAGRPAIHVLDAAGRRAVPLNRCGSCPPIRPGATSGAIPTVSRTRRWAPTRRASIFNSLATRPSWM